MDHRKRLAPDSGSEEESYKQKFEELQKKYEALEKDHEDLQRVVILLHNSTPNSLLPPNFVLVEPSGEGQGKDQRTSQYPQPKRGDGLFRALAAIRHSNVMCVGSCLSPLGGCKNTKVSPTGPRKSASCVDAKFPGTILLSISNSAGLSVEVFSFCCLIFFSHLAQSIN